VRVAFSVVETTDCGAVLGRLGELVPEMRTVKRELCEEGGGPGVAAFFMAVVDIVNLRSVLVLMGNAERSLAEAAYGGPGGAPLGEEVAAMAGEDGARFLYGLGDRVSRKADFVPPLSDAVARGWAPPLQRTESELSFEPIGSPTMDYSRNASGDIVRVQGAEPAVAARPATVVKKVSSFARLCGEPEAGS